MKPERVNEGPAAVWTWLKISILLRTRQPDLVRSDREEPQSVKTFLGVIAMLL
jgi:hypothetical protein